MKTVLKVALGIVLGFVVLIVGCAVLISSGTDSDVKDSSDNDGDGKPKKAQIGDPITLEGTDVKMKVTASKVLDPTEGGEFDEPEAGHRYVGVQVALANVGDKAYDDSPSNGAKLLTTTDEQVESTILSGGPCSSSFGSSAKIGPGARRQGCIAFDVPSSAKIKTFQFGLDSGFGPQTGEWRLR